MRKLFWLSLAIVVLGATLAAPLSAQARKKTPADPNQAFDPKAAAIFEKSCNYLASLKGFSFRAEALLDLVYRDNAKIQIARNMDVTVQRPNAFKIVTIGDDVKATSVYDGKTFTLALADKKVFGQLPATLDNDGLISLLTEKFNLESPLGDMLSNTPCAKMSGKFASYLGMGYVGDALCHHLFFQSDDIDWQIWIEDGNTPLPRKLLITEKKMPKAPQFTAFLRHWQIANNPPATFAFVPPQDFTRDGDFFSRQNWKR